MKDEKFERKGNYEIELLMLQLEMNIFPPINSYDTSHWRLNGFDKNYLQPCLFH